MANTSNHNWEIPDVNGSKDVWGQILNDFFDDELDRQVKLEGNFADRPAAGSSTVKYYHATDRRIVYYNDGNSWEAVYGLGTDSNPVPGTSHFESISAETLVDDYYYTGAYDGADANIRLDNALSDASAGDFILLENAEYDGNRTVSTAVVLQGIETPASNGTRITATWTLSDRCVLRGFSTNGATIDVQSERVQIDQFVDNANSNINVNGDRCLITNGYFIDVTFSNGTTEGLVDSCINVSVTDNDGSNVQGDIS